MPYHLRFFLFLFTYATIAGISYFGAWLLRFGYYPDLSGIPEQYKDLWWQQALYYLPLKLLFLYAFGQFHGFIRFFRFPDAVRLAMASGGFSFCCLVVWYFTSIQYVPPALVLAADFLLFTFFTMSLRVGIRLVDEWRQGYLQRGRKAERVAVIGVGEVGSSLVSQLLAQPGQGMRPVAFFDDSKLFHGRSLHGLPVLGAPEEIPGYFESHDWDKVVLAMPSASPERIREISILLKLAKIPLETVPSIGQLLRGAPATELRELRIEDLLYREPVAVDMEQVRRLVQGKRVWVTGAGGSIGSELAFQLAHLEPAELMLIDASEGALFQVERRLLEEGFAFPLKVAVLDLRDHSRVDEWMQQTKPELIYHAAAHKHVGMMERQPRQAFANNTIVTLHLARQAVAQGVESFCLISTDKAVEPSSVMGATKRLAEKAIKAMIDSGKAGSTVFSMVRFGNVLGSSGSVIPIFEQQIAERHPVTVTDKEMTRYFMTIAEAVGLVLQATAFKARAALFTLDMGEPVRIDDVARDLIRLKGLEPDVDIPIVYTGIGPGEKLHETIHYPIEKLEATAHPKIQRVLLTAKEVTTADAFLQSIESLAEKMRQLDDVPFRQALFDLLSLPKDQDGER